MKWLFITAAGLACLVGVSSLIFGGTVLVNLQSNCTGEPSIILSQARFRPLVSIGHYHLFVIVGGPEGGVTVSFGGKNQFTPPNSYVTSGMISFFSFRADSKCKIEGGLRNL